jgi:protein SCO1/2
MTHRKMVIGLVSLGILALAMGVFSGEYLFRYQHRSAPDITGIYLRDFQILDEFHLIRHDGSHFTRDSLKGKWTFLYFGYSYCPDICPLTMVVLDHLQQILFRQGVDQDAAYLFISVDPQRDTPEKLRAYVTHFNPRFQGITGTPEELGKLANPLKVFYQRSSDNTKTDNYIIDHTSTIILVDPYLQPRAIFTPPQNPENIASDFLKIRANVL